MSLPPMDDYHHELARAQLAREAYINWRMNDIPAVYKHFMPVTENAAELWESEKAIRRQYERDQEEAKSPWKKIGPSAQGLLDYTGLEGQERAAFGRAAEVPPGLPGVPKPGRYPEAMEDLKKRIVPGIDDYCERLRIGPDGKYLPFDENDKSELPKHHPG